MAAPATARPRADRHALSLAAPDADWPNAAAGALVAAAGTRWYVQRMGTGPCLLLVHGTGAASHSWRDLMPILARHFDVIAPDLPGHGFSQAIAAREMTLPGLAARLGRLLDAMGARPAFAVGHSAGAAIVLSMALEGRLPARGLVGLNAALLPYGGMLQRLFRPLARLLASGRLATGMFARRARDRRAVLRLLESTGSVLDDDGVRTYQRLLTCERHVGATLAMMAHWDLTDLLRDLHALVPRLTLIVGDGDRAVAPGEARKVQRYLPSLHIREIEGGGHLVHEEQPQRVASMIVEEFRLTVDQDGR